MTPTVALYEQDAFLQEFDSRIAAVDRGGPLPRIALEATAFYPEGGGQPCDTGLLLIAGQDPLGWAVTEVHTVGGVIWHTLNTLDGEHPLPDAVQPGCAVRGQVNWRRRFDHMQQHTGEHILSGTLHRLYGAQNVGFHIGAAGVRMDTDIPLSWQQLRMAEVQANQVIWSDAPVQCTVYPEQAAVDKTYRSKKELDGPVRIVEIPGGDCCACCGTHVLRAGQVGQIKILAAEHYKGGMRLTVACGRRALEESEAMRTRQQRIGALLSAKADETANAVERLNAEKAALDYNYYGLCQQLFELLAQKAAETPDTPALVTLPGLEAAWLARLANRLAAAVPGTVCAALSANERGTGYCIASGSVDVRPLTKALNAALNGKGGGKPNSCQGSCAGAEPQQVEAALRQLLAEG